MINYKFIQNSIDFYIEKGFERVEVPWTVTKEISDITKPVDAKDFRLIHENGKVLVGSAEQSFLYQYSKGFLPKGKFQAVTPCFRFENHDETHKKYFIKNELIITDNVSKESLTQLRKDALEYFCTYFDREKLVVIATSSDGNNFDIMYDNNSNYIELGSYGIRTCNFLEWIYGTATAEPRLSYAYGLSQKKN